jgi:hypothetical protein
MVFMLAFGGATWHVRERAEDGWGLVAGDGRPGRWQPHPGPMSRAHQHRQHTTHHPGRCSTRTTRADAARAATSAYANRASATAHLVPRGPAPPSQGLAGGALDAAPVPSQSAQARRMTAGALKATNVTRLELLRGIS